MRFSKKPKFIEREKKFYFYQFNFCGEVYELIKEMPDGEDKEYLKSKLREYLNSCNQMVNEL